MVNNGYRICSRCVMDTSDPDIVFNDNGECNHCANYSKKVNSQLVPIGKRCGALDEIQQRIIEKGKGSQYDCVVGVSGGVDSSYVALLAKDLGLRALLVHLDNGWNSDIAVKNIRNIADKCGFELYTHVIYWNEFRDIQLSLFRASVVDIELATDHAIKAVLYRIALKYNIKYILNGGNVVTEAIMPVSWRHTKADRKNILAIQKEFGQVALKTYPTAGILKQLFYKYALGKKSIKILNYVEFDRDTVISRLKNEVDWKEYGGKHHESIFTRFYQAYILPEKFGIDKRRCHFSNLICANQLSRSAALEKISDPVYDLNLLENDREFVIKKLGFSQQELENYIGSPEIAHSHYKSDVSLIRVLQKIRKKL